MVAVSTNLERPVQQVLGKAALRFHRLENARPKKLEQSWHDDHDRRLHLLDICGKLLETLRVINLAAKGDWKQLATHVLVGVACRQKRQEHLVVPAKIG